MVELEQTLHGGIKEAGHGEHIFGRLRRWKSCGNCKLVYAMLYRPENILGFGRRVFKPSAQ